jgi:hypothetical protein
VVTVEGLLEELESAELLESSEDVVDSSDDVV